MTTIKCKYCGGSITLTGSGHGYCDYCGQELTLPSRQEERLAAMYERAGHFRALGEFDRAYSAYQHLVEENPEDPELHWCMTLCRYGVEYVEDKRLSDEAAGIREYKPTMSRMSFEPILEDPDYKEALAFADETGRRLYRQEAGKLARIQGRYLEIIRKEEPYDVFISFQSEEADGTRTKASVLGQEIYEQLTGRGLKVFFSRITLEGIQGQEFEPYIFAALRTSKVMLLVADNGEQMKGRWVRNEWSRFLSMMEEDRSKSIVPVYNSMGEARMSPYDFPDAIATTQAQDMAKVGAMQDLVRGVCKLTGHEETARVVVLEGGATLENLLRRADNALKDRDFREAKDLLDKVLDVDAQNPQAHMYQLLLVNRASTFRDLLDIRLDWSEDRLYQRAKRYAGDRQRAELVQFEEDCRREAILRRAREEAQEQRYEKALSLLEGILEYQGASALADQCVRQKEREDVLVQYRQEIGDGGEYLSMRFRKEYPEEAKQWETLKQKAEAAESVRGGIFSFGIAAISLAYAIGHFGDYYRYSNEDACFYGLLWAAICGYAVWKRSQKFPGMFKGMILPGAFFFLLAVVSDSLYQSEKVPFYVWPYTIVAVSIALLFFCGKIAGKELFRGRTVRRKEEYYMDTVMGAERNLRRKVKEEWAGKIQEENMIEMAGIR